MRESLFETNDHVSVQHRQAHQRVLSNAEAQRGIRNAAY
jgi:hypothetical protein